jgi:hypothetical protein
MTTYGVTYTLGAAITVVVEADDEDAAAVEARTIADDQLAAADDLLAGIGHGVELIGPAYLVDVDEVIA